MTLGVRVFLGGNSLQASGAINITKSLTNTSSLNILDIRQQGRRPGCWLHGLQVYHYM